MNGWRMRVPSKKSAATSGTTGCPWRRATKADAGAVEAFLRSRESRAAGLIARLLSEGRLRIPSPLGPSGLWIREEVDGFDASRGAEGRAGAEGRVGVEARASAEGRAGAIQAAVLGLSGGLWFVQLPEGGRNAAGLALALEEASRKPGFGAPPKPLSVIGPASSVAAFEGALGLSAAHRVDYILMERGAWGSPSAAPPSEAKVPLSLWKASPADLDELLPLQEAYEKEEVITPLRGFDAESCRSFLARNLAAELIVGARLAPGAGASRVDRGGDGPRGALPAGRAIGKAATNARAFTLDQIGGVFVEPGFRGRGVARAMMAFLLGSTAKEGRGASLFVKKGNTPALVLYERLGFAPIDDFRASYHLPR